MGFPGTDLCFSSFQPNRKSSNEEIGSHEPGLSGNTRISRLAMSDMVCTSTEAVTQQDGSTRAAIHKDTSTREVSSLDVWTYIKSQLLAECQFSLVAADLVINSLRHSSQKQYASYLKRFFDFLNGKPLHTCNEKDLINYIEHLYSSGLGYSACNTARSAVSTMFDIIFKTPIGQDRHVSRLLKGIFESRPALPRHAQIWDTDVLVRLLDYDSDKVDLIRLSRKVVTLLVVLSCQRVSAIHSIMIDDVFWGDDHVTVKITSLLKQSRKGFHQAPLTFKKYSNSNLCPYYQLKLYLEKTKELRGGIRYVWITTTLPTKRAQKQTVANWIRFCLREAGLADFTPHSLRAAAASKAISKNVNVDAILMAGGWSGTSVFARFYNLPIRNVNPVADAIL